MAEVIEHKESSEAFAAFMEALQEVASGDRWLAACWRVKDGKIEIVRATSYEFPNGDMLAAVGHLALQLFEMSKNDLLPDNPLPMANLPWLNPNAEGNSKGEENQ
jgi:hypothetical protein